MNSDNYPQACRPRIGVWKRLLKTPEIILLLLLAFFGVSLAWNNSSVNSGVDFYQFWTVGQSLHRAGVGNIYSDEARELLGAKFLEKAKQTANPDQLAVANYRQKLQTYSSPFLYSLFGVFSTGDFSFDFRNYRLLMLASLVCGICILCHLLNHSVSVMLGIIAITTGWFEPFASDMRVGNVNTLQFVVLAIWLWMVMRVKRRHGDFFGGALLGLALAFKPNLLPVIFVLAAYWLAVGKFRQLRLQFFGALAGGTAAILFAGVCFGNFRCWIDWLIALRSMPDEIITVELGNFSLAQLIKKSLGLNVAIPLAIVFCGMVLVCVYSRRRNVEEFSEVFAVSLGCLFALLTAPLTWLHYYILTLPALLFLLRPGNNNSTSRQLLPIVALMSLAITPIFYFGISLSARIQGSLVVCGALLLFLALTIYPHRSADDKCCNLPGNGA